MNPFPPSFAHQAQLARLEQELQDFRVRERFPTGGAAVTGANQDASDASAIHRGAGAAGSGVGASHADAVEMELAELTRVNSQLRGELVAKEAAWRDERASLEAAASVAKVCVWVGDCHCLDQSQCPWWRDTMSRSYPCRFVPYGIAVVIFSALGSICVVCPVSRGEDLESGLTLALS